MGFDARGREWPLAEMISVLQKEGQYLWSSRGFGESWPDDVLRTRSARRIRCRQRGPGGADPLGNLDGLYRRVDQPESRVSSSVSRLRTDRDCFSPEV